MFCPRFLVYAVILNGILFYVHNTLGSYGLSIEAILVIEPAVAWLMFLQAPMVGVSIRLALGVLGMLAALFFLNPLCDGPFVATLHFAMPVPDYLERHYWWAYARDWAVRFWDRPWLINLILYGNYERLRDAALAECDGTGRTLKISACYGSLTPALALRCGRAGGTLDVIDILPMQVENARRKTSKDAHVTVSRMNAAALSFGDASFDQVLLFFLMHELPQAWRERVMTEALRVAKPGAGIVIVDFGKPEAWHPFRYLWLPFLGILEPFARALWKEELPTLLPEQMGGREWKKESYFGGLFQKLVTVK